MGAAFERGFSSGILQYKEERLTSIGGDLLVAEIEKSNIEKQIGQDRLKELNKGILIEPKTELERQYKNIGSKILNLKEEKQKLENLEIEMVIDLSSHQIDYCDKNANRSYFMMASENISFAERVFINEKWVGFSEYIGKMQRHHSSGADPSKFPSANNRDDK